MIRLNRRPTVLVSVAFLSTAVILAGCSTKAASSSAGNSGATTAAVADLSSIKVGLVPGGAHPYFQPWKAGAQQAVTEFGSEATRLTRPESGIRPSRTLR